MTNEEKYNQLVSFVKGMHQQVNESHKLDVTAPAVEYLNAIVEEIEYIDSCVKRAR